MLYQAIPFVRCFLEVSFSVNAERKAQSNMLNARRGRHSPRLLQPTIVAILLVLLGYIEVRQRWVQHDSRPPNGDPGGSVVMPQVESRELDRLVGRHELIVDNRHDTAVPVRAAPDELTGTTEIRSSPSKAPLDFDLAVYFLKSLGSLDAARVGRHVDLNPRGLCLTGERHESLRRILASANAMGVRLHEDWKEVRRREMISQIEAGRVTAAPERPPSEGDVRFLAETLLASTDLSSKGYTMESLSEEIRKSPGIGFGAGVDIFVHDGKTYCMADFEKLPASDSLIDSTRYFAWAALARSIAWSLEHGCSPNEAQVAFALDRILSVSATELRGSK